MSINKKPEQKQNLNVNMKAEILAYELMRNKAEKKFATLSEHILFELLGNDKRAFRKEIDSFKFSEDDAQYHVKVNRSSVYDQLPEVMFHEPKVRKENSLNDIKEEFQKLKREEKEARKFFAPFDNEILKVLSYKELIYQQNGNIDALKSIWPLPKYFTKFEKETFWRYLPYYRFIKNSNSHIEEFLSLLLGVAVKIDYHNRSFVTKIESDSSDFLLGENSILQGEVNEYKKLVKIKLISPDSKICERYFNGNQLHSVVSYMFDILFPADFSFELILDEAQDKKNVISPDEDGAILGFSLYI